MDFLSSCTSGGCGAKIGPHELSNILKQLPVFADSSLIVGFDHSDDAAVYQISEDTALISTLDFFSPMVEEPKTFGRIAAANALSDVYAMGGNPLFALNMVCFPQKMPKKYLAEILQGGAEKLQEAGAVLAGGHSIYDHEVKYGLAVTGKVAPEKLIANNTPQVGDALILTKALGVGLIQSAARAGIASEASRQAAVASMERLNKYAAEKLKDVEVHACTDITGFGLLVHGSEMAAEHATLIIATEMLPILPGAYQYAEQFLATAGGQRNRNFIDDSILLEDIPLAMQELLFDPQTSGGLLISVSEKEASSLLAEIQKEDPVAAIIGQVVKREKNQPIILV